MQRWSMNAKRQEPVDCAAERLCIALSIGPNCGIRDDVNPIETVSSLAPPERRSQGSPCSNTKEELNPDEGPAIGSLPRVAVRPLTVSACLPASTTVYSTHETPRRIKPGRGLDHDRTQNRRATDCGTSLYLLSGMLLCVVEQDCGKTLVSEHAQNSRRRN